MPAPLNVDREAVRVLVVAVGPREAARRMNLSENTVLAWSDRGGWLDHLKPENQPQAPASMLPTVAINAIKPADALRNVLAEDDHETRISLSRGVRRMAKDAETATLDRAGDVLQTTKAAALLHNWSGSPQSVRISMFAPGQAIEVEAEFVADEPENGP